LIVATTGLSALAAKEATSSIPIVVGASADAVKMGIVGSLARPDGNVTGLTVNSTELAGKRLELLAELPGVKRIVALWCPGPSVTFEELAGAIAAAKRLGVELETVDYVQGVTAWQSVAEAIVRARPQALSLQDCTVLPFGEAIEFATRHGLPAITPYGSLAERGVLLSYGPDVSALARRSATFVHRILKGAKPADLPVEQPTEFELIVNLKTARTIGIQIPQSLLLRATRVIE
jgi:putative ABC transport system substrate-binding protein